MHVLYLLWNHIMLYYTLCSYFQLVIFIFILTLVLYHLLYEVVLYMISIYVCIYICMSFCMYILFCNKAPWKNSLTEWSTLYKYIWNKKIKIKKVIIKCPNCSWTPDWSTVFALVFAICQILCDEMIVPYVLSSSLYTLMWMDICISYCIYHTELCFSF